MQLILLRNTNFISLYSDERICPPVHLRYTTTKPTGTAKWLVGKFFKMLHAICRDPFLKLLLFAVSSLAPIAQFLRRLEDKQKDEDARHATGRGPSSSRSSTTSSP